MRSHCARRHPPRYSAALAVACSCLNLIVRGLRCPGSTADDCAGASPVVARRGTGGMADRLCIVCLGMRPHPGQTARKWDAWIAASKSNAKLIPLAPFPRLAPQT